MNFDKVLKEDSPEMVVKTMKNIKKKMDFNKEYIKDHYREFLPPKWGEVLAYAKKVYQEEKKNESEMRCVTIIPPNIYKANPEHWDAIRKNPQYVKLHYPEFYVGD